MGHRFPLFRQFHPRLTARLSLPVKCLRNRRRSAHLTESQDFNLKIAAVILYSQQVADPDLARRLRWLSVGFDPAEFTCLCGERPRFEKSGGPEPLVDSYAGGLHEGLLCTAGGLAAGVLAYCSGGSKWMVDWASVLRKSVLSIDSVIVRL